MYLHGLDVSAKKAYLNNCCQLYQANRTNLDSTQKKDYIKKAREYANIVIEEKSRNII